MYGHLFKTDSNSALKIFAIHPFAVCIAMIGARFCLANLWSFRLYGNVLISHVYVNRTLLSTCQLLPSVWATHGARKSRRIKCPSVACIMYIPRCDDNAVMEQIWSEWSRFHIRGANPCEALRLRLVGLLHCCYVTYRNSISCSHLIVSVSLIRKISYPGTRMLVIDSQTLFNGLSGVVDKVSNTNMVKNGTPAHVSAQHLLVSTDGPSDGFYLVHVFL